MQAKLREVLLVSRPTKKKDNGRIPIAELGRVLELLGFKFLTTPDDIKRIQEIVQGEDGMFKTDDLIDHLCQNHAMKYSSAAALRDALKLFDFDNDGKIQFGEFEYFMKNFGTGESDIHMNAERMQAMLDVIKT